MVVKHRNISSRLSNSIKKRSKSILLETPRVLILTEGYTEQLYFTFIINSLKLKTVEVQKSRHTNASSIVDEAIKLAKEALSCKNEYNYIFCVFDLDTLRVKDYINTLNKKISKKTKIFPIYSNPCFEIWLILHYELILTPFSAKGKKSIGEVVKNYIKSKYLLNYSENNKDSIQEIAQVYLTAIMNAQSLVTNQEGCKTINPITTVHKLLIFLQNINTVTFNRDIENFVEKNL